MQTDFVPSSWIYILTVSSIRAGGGFPLSHTPAGRTEPHAVSGLWQEAGAAGEFNTHRDINTLFNVHS